MECPALEEVIACIEAVKGESWEEFKDRNGDSGRDLVMYLGRGLCGMKLKELGEGVGLRDYAPVAMGVRRYAARLEQLPKNQKELNQTL